MQASNREEISKTDMRKQIESIKAHIDLYKLTLHNVGYKEINWKKQTKYPPFKQINSQIIIVASFGP